MTIINNNSCNNSSIVFITIIIIVLNYVISISSNPTSDAGIIGEFESLSIDSKEINNILGQLSPNINLNRYFFLNHFKEFENLNPKAKYHFPNYQINLVQGKKQVQYLSLNGNGENLKTRQPVSYDRYGYPKYKETLFSIGTLYDISIYVDTNLQTSKHYESFIRNQSLATSNDYKTKKLLEENCTYLKLKLFKDYQGLLSTQQFLCFNTLHELTNSDGDISDDGNADSNSNNNNNHYSYQDNSNNLESTISNLNYNSNQNNHQQNHIKVMSYNTWNFNDPWRERRVKMADVIVKESPDIICFQELRFSSWSKEKRFRSLARMGEERNQVQHIWKLLAERNQKYHFIYLPSMVYTTNSGLQFEGLGIFSKLPITDTSSIKLSRDTLNPDDAHQRSLLRVQVYLKQQNLYLNVFTSHFSLEAEGSKRNAYESLNYINQFPKPSLFMGDLNLEPTANAIKYLVGDYEINQHVGDLIDTWYEFSSRKIKHHSNNPLELDQLNKQTHQDCSYTDLVNGYTFPTLYGAPNKRIDFLFRSNDNYLKVLDFKITGKCKESYSSSYSSSSSNNNNNNNNNNDLYPSDHTSIITTFEII